MLEQTILAIKHSATQLAGKRLSFFVNAFEVSIEVTLVIKGLTAEFTCELTS